MKLSTTFALAALLAPSALLAQSRPRHEFGVDAAVAIVKPDEGDAVFLIGTPVDIRVGILSQVSFLSLNSHPGTSSPTLRGKALREKLLCQKVPPPPANDAEKRTIRRITHWLKKRCYDRTSSSNMMI